MMLWERRLPLEKHSPELLTRNVDAIECGTEASRCYHVGGSQYSIFIFAQGQETIYHTEEAMADVMLFFF